MKAVTLPTLFPLHTHSNKSIYLLNELICIWANNSNCLNILKVFRCLITRKMTTATWCFQYCFLYIEQSSWFHCIYLCAMCSVMSDYLCPMDCSLLGSAVRGIFQARILEWVAISSSRGSSWARQGLNPRLLYCRQILYLLIYLQ